jgi:hypothetical protein
VQEVRYGAAARRITMQRMEDAAHLRIDALHRRIEHLEEHLRRLHEHVGLGPLPERPAPTEGEVATIKRLLQDGQEAEAERLHRVLTGQGREEARAALESLRAGR